MDRLSGRDHSVKLPIHLELAFFIEFEAHRTTHERVFEDALADEEMLLHGEKTIQTRLHRNERRQWPVDAVCSFGIPGFERFPKRHQATNKICPRHGADDATLEGIDERYAASAFNLKA